MSQNDSQSIQDESNNELNLNKSENLKEEEEPMAEETNEEKKLNEDQNNDSSGINNSNNNESRVNSNSNENSEEKNKIKLKDDEIMVEVMDRGVNTDDLDASELERLVKENKELNVITNDDKGNVLNKDSIEKYPKRKKI